MIHIHIKNSNKTKTCLLCAVIIALLSIYIYYLVLNMPEKIQIPIDIDKSITLNIDNNNNISTTLRKIGYNYENNDFIEMIKEFNNEILLPKRLWLYYICINSINLNDKMNVILTNKENQEDIEERVSSFNYEPSRSNISYSWSDNKIICEPGEKGKTFYLKCSPTLKSYDDVKVMSRNKDYVFSYTSPPVVIGSSTTKYTGSDQLSRNKNMLIATKKLNGICILPDEIFSMYKTLSPFTEENGYESAGVIKGDIFTQEIGGGACQVTTTLYNAVIRAELEVIERHNHTTMVGYVAPSFDATIAGEYVDFKFKNTNDYPIYIFTSMNNGVIKINIVGQEDRDENRKIDFNSFFDQKAGEWSLYKTVTIGEEKHNIKINTSKYK